MLLSARGHLTQRKNDVAADIGGDNVVALIVAARCEKNVVVMVAVLFLFFHVGFFAFHLSH